jgi:hypothetical protein
MVIVSHLIRMSARVRMPMALSLEKQEDRSSLRIDELWWGDFFIAYRPANPQPCDAPHLLPVAVPFSFHW